MSNLLVPFNEYTFPSRYDGPLDHQIAMVVFYLKNKRAFNLSTMGTGKTLATLWALDLLLANSLIKKSLIVAPLSVIGSVWADEIFLSFRHRKCVILHGSKQQRIAKLRTSDAEFFIINTDGIKVIEEELAQALFDVIVIDELTSFKDSKTDRFKSMKYIAKNCNVVWGLTGSPASEGPKDAYGQAKLVNPNNVHLPRYFTKYKEMVMEKDEYLEHVWNPKPGWEHVVARILSPSIRFELRDCVDLPATIYVDRQVNMSKEQKDAYDKMSKEFAAEVDNKLIVASNAGVKYSKLLQISSGVVLDVDGNPVTLNAKSKMEEVVSIFKEGGKEPVIVYISYVQAIFELQKFLSKYRVRIIYGGVPLEERNKTIRDFQDGLIDFILMQPITASHGITLTRSSTIIWYTPFLSNERTRQANARIVRTGQTKTQLIVRLFVSDKERQVYQALDKKEDLSQLLLNLYKQ